MPDTHPTSFGGATHLECTRCGARYESEALHRLSPCCEKPLYPRYDLAAIGARLTRDELACRSADLWRYHELLPVRDPANAVRLGEGWTPLIDTPRLASRLALVGAFGYDLLFRFDPIELKLPRTGVNDLRLRIHRKNRFMLLAAFEADQHFEQAFA